MLKQILESNNYGYVYIKKIGGKGIDEKVYELEDEVSGKLPEFNGKILGNLIERFQEDIAYDLEEKGLLKKGYGTIGVGLEYEKFNFEKGYKFKVKFIEVIDEEGENRDGTIEELKEFIDFIENCKEIELDFEDKFPYDWKIFYNSKALKCYPQFPMDI